MRIAIFGGTFDPIHAAHIAIAIEARRHFSLDEVWFVPAAQPPHKAGVTRAPYQDRFRMVELACAGHEGLHASRLEEGSERSYSIDTITRVKAARPGDEIFFLIGSDAFAEITTWRRWTEVIQMVEFLVVVRPGHEYTVPEGARVRRLESLALPVSSSEIRRNLSTGGSSGDLPVAVLEHIRAQHLYQPAP
ncbi:MAG: nicotinate (nicotinamide) nucleotide adenylyltransferase [Acidobacteriia bacterium]|nr:nicotinate (nicotinamide) nucleotide adenylyltransferase [Terriglobia bacterium]